MSATACGGGGGSRRWGGWRARRARGWREVAGRRAGGRLEGAAPAAVFEAVEKDALRPLPAGPFVLATWATAKIGPDIHAQVEKVLYSIPWQHIARRGLVAVDRRRMGRPDR